MKISGIFPFVSPIEYWKVCAINEETRKYYFFRYTVFGFLVVFESGTFSSDDIMKKKPKNGLI